MRCARCGLITLDPLPTDAQLSKLYSEDYFAHGLHGLDRLGRTAKLTIVRGGTDGSRLTEKGLPTPNLATGEHNPHSPLEWACLEEMVSAVEWIAAIAKAWEESAT